MPRTSRIEPSDTVDERPGEVPDEPLSLGVVDDTCDARLVAELNLGTGTLQCSANITVAPPHFAPDRRPFLSLADEINDREHDPDRDAAMTWAERAAWVEDLFERVFETASLLDLDFWRGRLARQLLPEERRPAIPGDCGRGTNA